MDDSQCGPESTRRLAGTSCLGPAHAILSILIGALPPELEPPGRRGCWQPDREKKEAFRSVPALAGATLSEAKKKAGTSEEVPALPCETACIRRSYG